MKASSLISTVLILAISQSASATFWGKVKNAFNDCKYSAVERAAVINAEKNLTPYLSDNNFGPAFSTNDFYEKPWLKEFRLVIVVNKSAKGPNAQTLRMYEFGSLVLTTKVSTGREDFELRRKTQACTGAPPKSYWSQTPTGYYTPKFLSIDHKSSSWDSYMPFAVFYDVENGLALHQVYSSYEKYLGGRASGGCTRLAKGIAEDVFTRVVQTQGANVPAINKDGTPVLDESGNMVYGTSQIWTDPRNGRVRKFNSYGTLIIVEENK